MPNCGGLKQQAQLPQSYFEALGTLGGGDAPSGIGAAAKGVVDSLAELQKGIAGSKVGEMFLCGRIGRSRPENL